MKDHHEPAAAGADIYADQAQDDTNLQEGGIQ